MQKYHLTERKKQMEERNNNQETAVEVVKAEDIIPLNAEKALKSYSQEEQAEIRALSEEIDVKKVDNVMRYGSTALVNTFNQCGQFLKEERGSRADQEVINRVIELSKKAAESNDEFNLSIKEPTLFQRFLQKITSEGENRAERIQARAVNSFKLVDELKRSCDEWIRMLEDTSIEIEEAGMGDVQNITLLEKYLIAGDMARERIEKDCSEAKQKYEETGLQTYAQQYQNLKEGLEIFEITMANLEKSRVMYKLSIGQLMLIRKSNRDVRISIETKTKNSLALLGQQLRNAVLNAKVDEVSKGQRALTKLNDEVIKDVSRSVGLTAAEAEKLLYTSFYNTVAAKEAVETVIKTCNEIQKVATDALPKMKADVAQMNDLIKELEPAISAVTQPEARQLNDGEPDSNRSGYSELKF